MKWIFALLFLFSVNIFAVESVPAPSQQRLDPNYKGACNVYTTTGQFVGSPGAVTASDCTSYSKTLTGSYVSTRVFTSYSGFSDDQIFTTVATNISFYVIYKSPSVSDERYFNVVFNTNGSTRITSYYCPPSGSPDFSIGPVDLNGSKVCQKPPKVCMMGAIVRVDKDGKETCVPNCSSAAGLTHSSQYFFQAGPTAGSTAGEVTCYGQCSIKTVGGGVQLSSGAWTGNFTFTGANCSVIRPEPTVDSETNTSSNGSATPVDESTTSQGTTDALGQLNGAASAATGTQVQPSATGPDGTSTLHDVAQTVADSANAQIQATTAQNVATGNLIANTTKDLQNTIIKSVGGGGVAASLQAQGNGKLDGIGSAIGAGNGKLDGIQTTLSEISDKLDDPAEQTPFTPGAGSGAFWESVLPESSFTEMKDKTAASVQELKDLSTEFQGAVSFTELSASGAPDEWSLNMNGTVLPFGMGAFQMIIDMGLAAVILLLCALYAVYIITNRK